MGWGRRKERVTGRKEARSQNPEEGYVLRLRILEIMRKN
jgi:hypothetical protein